MSGEAVVLVGISIGTAGLTAATGAAALVAAGMVADWMREQHAIAQRNMRREKETAETWQVFHRSEQRETEKVTRQREALRQKLNGLQLLESALPVGEDTRSRIRGFVQDPDQGMRGMLQSVLEQIPKELGAEAAAPLLRLQQHARELDERMVSPAAPPDVMLQTFHTTVQRTLEQVLHDLEQEAASRRRLLEQVETLLGEGIAYRQLAREPASAGELSQLQEHLIRLLATGEVTAAGVALLDEKLRRLKIKIDGELERAAVQAVLRERLQRHLADLGYRLRSAAGEPEVWEVPGGERVRVALQPGNRLAFQLIHERPVVSARPLSGEELDFLRQQERRWCGDLHGLLQKLQEDGFEFQVQMERETPGEAVPVVVVEDVDQWIEEDGAHEAPRRRHLT